ncbi:E3 ubiquitin-protein ligase rnf8-A [Heracleum sosnowskyi]|uniref:E3 ubiquitin-protein ligase rnf8-A n=1 Tax=Heracleum sosnowskyi TaxID=360622 RepID=A0AAD8HZA0_9APIA|nr:E3 ubiquitin-protein ligase rnf8-A [Heracleum sosnowskyi]
MSNTSVQLQIPGMESVIATVSGYHGLQKLNLPKLISHAGGNYVGDMNRSVTHLICWKFEGRKYELARKLKIIVVNHRWIEDCIKERRRVPERSYTARCGKEVGCLLMDVPAVPDKVSNSVGNQSSARHASKKHVIDIDCDEDDNAVSLDSILLKENMFPEMERRKEGSKLKRRSVNKTSNQSLSSRATHDNGTPSENTYPEMERRNEGSKLKRRLVNRTTSQIHSSRVHDEETSVSCDYNEPEELDSSSPRRLRQKKISCYTKPLRRGRRLVRKNIVSDVLGSESEEECHPVHVPHWQDDITDLSNNPSASREASPPMINASEPVIRLAESIDFFDGESTSVLYASHQLATPKDSSATEPVIRLAELTDLSDGSPDLSATPKDFSEAEHVTRLNKSTDYSCVICWTDFSSTRGVLPCGHRFCFPCIQNWADHMSSTGKISTCPLCKASFDNITKVDDAVSSDQKIYSQSIPHDPSVNIYVLPMRETSTLRNTLSAVPACTRCGFQEPEDLLIRCHLCQIRCVHSYCLDPYMLPWTCTHCKDLRMLYHH